MEPSNRRLGGHKVHHLAVFFWINPNHSKWFHGKGKELPNTPATMFLRAWILSIKKHVHNIMSYKLIPPAGRSWKPYAVWQSTSSGRCMFPGPCAALRSKFTWPNGSRDNWPPAKSMCNLYPFVIFFGNIVVVSGRASITWLDPSCVTPQKFLMICLASVMPGSPASKGALGIT